MYSLQKFGTRSIHHSPRWQDHLRQYIYFTHRFNISLAPTDGQSRKITQVVLIPTQWCLVPLMLPHFFSPHVWSRWSLDSILTSMNTSEASSTTKESHMHTADSLGQMSMCSVVWVQCHRVLHPSNMLHPASNDINTNLALGLVVKQINPCNYQL